MTRSQAIRDFAFERQIRLDVIADLLDRKAIWTEELTRAERDNDQTDNEMIRG